VEAAAKSEKVKGRGREKDPDPDGPVAEAVDAGVALAHLALLGIFHLSAILHWDEFRRAEGWESIGRG